MNDAKLKRLIRGGPTTTKIRRAGYTPISYWWHGSQAQTVYGFKIETKGAAVRAWFPGHGVVWIRGRDNINKIEEL